MISKIKLKKLLILFSTLMFLTSCDITLEPISESEPFYSISGPLDIQSTPNFIRVHDITALLNPEATRELDLQLLFTNLSTMESTLLRDSVIVYENINTHNFIVEESIEFDTRYKIEIEDNLGFRDSLITVTTRETNLSISPDTVSCNQRFLIELTDVDLEGGERLDTEVAVQVNNTWFWTQRDDFYEYNATEKILTVGWSPDSVSQLLWPPPAETIACGDFSAQQVRFRFTHIGYVEGISNTDVIGEVDFSPEFVQQRNVLSRYGYEVLIYIEDEVFD